MLPSLRYAGSRPRTGFRAVATWLGARTWGGFDLSRWRRAVRRILPSSIGFPRLGHEGDAPKLSVGPPQLLCAPREVDPNRFAGERLNLLQGVDLIAVLRPP